LWGKKEAEKGVCTFKACNVPRALSRTKNTFPKLPLPMTLMMWNDSKEMVRLGAADVSASVLTASALSSWQSYKNSASTTDSDWMSSPSRSSSSFSAAIASAVRLPVPVPPFRPPDEDDEGDDEDEEDDAWPPAGRPPARPAPDARPPC
jgi:hypothetical protein